MRDERFQPIVAACGTGLAESKTSDFQRNVVHHGEALFGQQFIESRHGSGGLAAQIHISQRLQKNQARISRDFALELTIRLPAKVAFCHEPIQHVEPDIVPGAVVLATWIAEADEESNGF